MVDEQNSDRSPRELALFAGAGGGILGGHLLGWRTVCAVECEAYARDVLIARQDDGLLPPFPIWDDVRTFDGRPWAGRVDVVSGGFPCQDISSAGKGAGLAGARSGLWSEMARIVRAVRPRFVFVENSPVLTSRGLGVVLGDLAALGFDAEWCVLGADDCGAPHRRKRIWILAHTSSHEQRARLGDEPSDQRPSGGHASAGCGSQVPDADGGERDAGSGDKRAPGRTQPGDGGHVADSDQGGCLRRRITEPGGEQGAPGNKSHGCGGARRIECSRPAQWPPEPDVGRVAHGVAARVDRLRATGNGQVSRVAAAAYILLKGRLCDT